MTNRNQATRGADVAETASFEDVERCSYFKAHKSDLWYGDEAVALSSQAIGSYDAGVWNEGAMRGLRTYFYTQGARLPVWLFTLLQAKDGYDGGIC